MTTKELIEEKVNAFNKTQRIKFSEDSEWLRVSCIVYRQALEEVAKHAKTEAVEFIGISEGWEESKDHYLKIINQ